MNSYRDIVFVEFYKAVNLGDDLLVKTLFDRYPNRKFIVIAGPEYSDILSEFKNVQVVCSPYARFRCLFDNYFHNKSYINRIASKCSSSILIGGSLFIEPFIPKFNNRLYSDNPFFIIGSNFGPYKSNSYYDYCREFFITADDVCFRDNESYNLFSDLKNVRCAPDIIFGVQPHLQNECSGVFVSVMNFTERSGAVSYYQTDYEKFIIDAIRNNRAHNERIYLCSFCKREGDEKTIDSIVGHLSDTEITDCFVLKYDGLNSNEILECIGKSRLVIGTRFHSVILGLIYGKKVIAISYSNKTNNLLNDLGFKNCYVCLNECENGQYTEICLNNAQINDLKDRSQLQFNKLDAVFVSQISENNKDER